MKHYSRVTLHVSPKNPISREKLKITSTKIQISIPQIFLSDFVKNKLKLYVFGMDFMKKLLKLIVSKKCWFPSSKGSNILTLFYLTVKQLMYLKHFII